MHTHTLFNPAVVLELDGGPVTVKQLPFLRALEFLQMLSGVSAKLFDQAGHFRLFTPARAGQPAIVNTEAIAETLRSSTEVVVFLITNSTGKDVAWLGERSATEGMALLQTAVRINLDEELLKQGNGLAGVLTATFTRTPAHRSQRPSTS